MTADEIRKELRTRINNLNPETLESGWVWSYTEDKTDAEHLESYRETLEKTRARFGTPEKTALWFVSTPEDSVLAFCGNSPSAKDRAAYLACLSPKIVLRLLDEMDRTAAQLAEMNGRASNDR